MRFQLFICVLTSTLAATSTAVSQERTADWAEIAAAERAWVQAYVTQDVAAVERLLADDFRGIDPSGNAYDKAATVRPVKEGPRETSDPVDELTIRFFGDTAIAQAKEHEIGPAPELRSTMHVFTDTWVKRDGHWRIVAAEDLDPGYPTQPRNEQDIETIRALRAANNQAIAAHDLAAVLSICQDDSLFLWSDGSSASGSAIGLQLSGGQPIR